MQTGIEVEFKHSGLEGRRFDPSFENTAYRVAQEALTNVARHAKAGKIAISAQLQKNSLEIRIADDGQGFDPRAASKTQHGLVGMRERIFLAGGKFKVDSAPGKGARILISLPLEEKGAA